MSTTSSGRLPELHLSDSGRQWLTDFVRTLHEDVVLAVRSCCAAPSLVDVVPAAAFRPQEGQTVVAMLSGRPVWGDPDQLRECPHAALVLVPTVGRSRSHHLMARPEDVTGERRA
jgi:hypothetical protein